MLNDLTHKALVVSVDECRTWQVYTTEFTPSTILHHPSIENLLVAHDLVAKKFYISQDFGRSFNQMLLGYQVVNFYW